MTILFPKETLGLLCKIERTRERKYLLFVRNMNKIVRARERESI